MRIPPWLRIKLPSNENFSNTSELIGDLHLNTVCQSAKCPNKWECFSKNVATFLVMGAICTRNCAFCNITSGDLEPLDPTEPARVAEAARRLNLKHVVITSVTRDDLGRRIGPFRGRHPRRARSHARMHRGGPHP